MVRQTNLFESKASPQATDSPTHTPAQTQNWKAAMLWVDKYRPRTAGEVVGQPKLVETVQLFLKKPKRALFLHGPPGIGKTAVVEAIANDLGYEVVRLNASDERGAKAIEAFAATGRTGSLFSKGKVILIDEADGISGTADRGGAGAIVDIIKQSRHPVVLVANDPYDQKLGPVRAASTIVKVSRVATPSIQKKLAEICAAEGIVPTETVLKNLARFANGDLRSAITDLQTAGIGKQAISDQDLEALGFRERGSDIYTILPAIYRSHNLLAARKLVNEGDKDPDELFLWVAQNAPSELSGADLAAAYHVLATADLFRSRIIKQQNYRFRAYLVDLISGLSAFKPAHAESGFIPYQPPNRMLQLGRTRFQRAIRDAAAAKLAVQLHVSKKEILRTIPYFRMFPTALSSAGLTPEEQNAVS